VLCNRLFSVKTLRGRKTKKGSPRLNSTGIFHGPVCTYFSVSIFRSLVDLGTALSKRSSVVIFDIFTLHPSAGITNQSAVGPLLAAFLEKQTGLRGSPFNRLQKGEKRKL